MLNLKKISCLFLGLSCALNAFAQDISCPLFPQLFQAYLNQHVVIGKLDDSLKEKTIAQYLESLDGTKTILLDADVSKIHDQLKMLLTKIEKEEESDCTALEKVQALVVARSEENEKFVKGFLDANYKLDENAEFIFDAKKRSYPKTAAEKNDFIKKLVHFQISTYLLGDMKLPEAKTQLAHRYELFTKRAREKSYIDQMNAFVNAFAVGLDPHSSFLSREQLEDFRIEFSLSLEGIGASLSSQDGYTVVEEIIPGGAADRAKVLRPKDKIIAVAQANGPYESVIDMDLRDVVKKIRGKKGTKVKLSVLRSLEKTERIEVEIVRDKVDLKEQAAKMTYEKRKLNGKTYTFGILDLPSFYGGEGEDGREKRSSYKDMEKLLIEAKAKKVSGVVLNLSRNGGGLLDEGVKISGLFIKEGPIVATKNKSAAVEVLSDTNSETVYSGPLIVLTSRVSASASEILAGAMKDYKRALIIGGDHTFGKGSVQAVYPLPKGIGAMKVTTGMFYVPGGHSTQHEGVKGDIGLPSVLNASEELGEKNLDNSLPAAVIAPFFGEQADSAVSAEHWTPISVPLVQQLKAKSDERVKKDSKFAEIRKEIDEIKKNQGVIRLSEILKKSDTDKKKKKDDEKKSYAERAQKADEPFINESVNILMDWVTDFKASSAAAKN